MAGEILYNKNMKKFLLYIFLFCAPFCAFAQYLNDNAEIENTNSYDVKFVLKQDASVILAEKFTIYSDGSHPIPFFRRNIKTDKKLENVNLYLNGHLIDISVGKKDNAATVRANDYEWFPLSADGKNTVILTYKLPKTVYSLFNTDYFKWDLQLKNLPYKIDKGHVIFKVDGSAFIKNSKVLFETPEGNVPFDLKEDFDFPIGAAFDKGLNISLDISFEPGFFEGTSTCDYLLKEVLIAAKKISVIVPVLVVLFMAFYSFTIWNKYGKDPKGPFVTEYAPPADITPAFAKAMLKRKIPLDFSYFIITLINLSLKNYIRITDYRGEICIESLKGPNSENLKEEDKIIYDSLFAYSPKIVLNKENGIYIANALKAFFNRMLVKREEYFTPNYWCMALPLLLTIISFLLLFAFEGVMLGVAAVCFIICLIILVLFFMIIDNVAPRYRSVYCKIMGFKQYMQIAEEGRVHFSDPLDEERLFCDYLAYAYAFGMEKKIIRKVKYKFDTEAIEAINNYLYNDLNIEINSHNIVEILKS